MRLHHPDILSDIGQSAETVPKAFHIGIQVPRQGQVLPPFLRPTGITQNIKDLLSSPEIENIFENSDFVYLLNQASGDRKILCERLNISNQQAAHISNAGPGEGLIFFGNVILPFVDDFPKDNELYSIMTTKLGETGKGENEHE